MNARRTKVWLGSLLLLGAVAAAAYGLASPSFAEPAGRVGATIASGLADEAEGDLQLDVDTLQGVTLGAPIYHLATGHERAPIAHVVQAHTAPDGAARIRLRFAPGFDGSGPWVLRVYPPRRGLGDSIRLAVPPETARHVALEMRRRLDRLWREELGPSLAERMPAFLDRIDPRNEGASRELITTFGDDVMERLRPYMDDLLNAITKALQKRLDFMDRMGVLWKFVRGDGKGIKRKVQPVAETAARTWWAANQEKVLAVLGDAFKERLPDIRRWLETDVLDAARTELLEPLLLEHQAQLEKEGEALVRLSMKEVVQSEEGGFRVRFAAMLRMTLLGKKRALLLLERPATPGAPMPPRED